MKAQCNPQDGPREWTLAAIHTYTQPQVGLCKHRAVLCCFLHGDEGVGVGVCVCVCSIGEGRESDETEEKHFNQHSSNA